MRYGIVFWGNSPNAKRIFLLQKRSVRVMMGLRQRDTCRSVLKKLNILTLASQYILSLIIFMISNLEYFIFNDAIHDKTTIHKGNLHVLQSHLAIRQKGVYYMRIKIFNSLPSHVRNLVQDRKLFLGKLKEILIDNSFYSVDELMLYCKNL
jgi:hypothetical protein